MESNPEKRSARTWVVGILAAVGAVTIVGGAALLLHRALSKPVMPLAVTFERAPLSELFPDQGYIAKLANTSGRYLAVKATMENKTLQQTMTNVVELPPEKNATNPVAFGPAEGWKFVSGETLTLTHEEYQPLSVTVP